jgi:hypothetical protein
MPIDLECEWRYVFDQAVCDVYVTSPPLLRREPPFEAVAFVADDEGLVRSVVKNEHDQPLTATHDTPRGAAEAIATLLEQRFGARRSGPSEVPNRELVYRIRR